MAPINLLQIGESVLDQTRKALPQAAAEAFLVRSDSRVTEWSENRPENKVIAQTMGLGLRVIDSGRLGFAYTNRWENEDVARLVDQAASSSRSTTPDPVLDVPESDSVVVDGLELLDPTLKRSPWEKRGEFLNSLDQEVKARSPRISKVLRGSYREGHAEVAVVNSRGVAVSYEGSSVSFGMACVAVEAGETQIGYAFQGARHYTDLNTAWVIDHAVDHTLSLLGGKRIPSGRYDLVLDPFVAAEMLDLFAGALRSDQVQKGKSFLAKKVGEQIGAPVLTLLDNGRLPRGLATAPFDAEGLPTQKTVLIRQGRLEGFLYDSYTARKEKRRSTGNAGRASYKGLPEPDPSNFYLEAGQRSPDEMIKSVKSGIYVRSVMGLHTVDTISGDYSVGLMGQRIENGVRTHAVRGVTMAGNLLDLLKNVEAVGSDLTFSGSIGSPTLWIRDVSIGGL